MIESRVLINCIRRALGDDGASGVLPATFDWDGLFDFAESQRMAAIIAAALRSHPDWNEKGGRFNDALNAAMYTESAMHFEMNELFDRFDKAGIDFFPFKGAVTKSLYPEPWMRYMCDTDILVRPGDIKKVGPIFEEAGFFYSHSGSVHVAYESPGEVYQVEVHDRLFSFLSDYSDWGMDIFDRLKPISPGSHHLVASDEDNFLIFLIHFEKHRKRDDFFVSNVFDFWFLPAARGNAGAMSEVKRLGLTHTYNILDDIMRTWLLGKRLPARSRNFEKYLLQANADRPCQHKYDVEAQSWQWHYAKIHENGARRLFPRKENMLRLYPKIKTRAWLAVYYYPFHAAKLTTRYIVHLFRQALYRLRGAIPPF